MVTSKGRPLDAWLRAGLVAGAVFAADQVTKQIATDRLRGEAPVDLPLGFELDYITNTGIAFGLLSDGKGLVIAVTVAVLIVLGAWLTLTPRRPWLWPAVGLLVGGALGNLADRVGEGAVVDFLDPPRWPAFNLADVAITAGVVLIVLSQVITSRTTRQ